MFLVQLINKDTNFTRQFVSLYNVSEDLEICPKLKKYIENEILWVEVLEKAEYKMYSGLETFSWKKLAAE